MLASQEKPREDSSEKQESHDASEVVPQQILSGDLFSRIKEYIFPSLTVLALAGSFGYIVSRVFQTSYEPAVVEKPISSRTLEENVDEKTNSYNYVSINGDYFMIDGRLGKNLDALERETTENLRKKYEERTTQVEDKYKGMTEKVVDEAKKAWGLEEPVKKTEEKKKEETNYHENVKKLNERYMHIANKDYRHIAGKK
ncbi:MAG: hypothetical protein AABW90_02880 [Nanoarchaeota archaeon]